MMDDKILETANKISQWTDGEAEVPLTGVEVRVEENHSGKRFLYVSDGDNAGYISIEELEKVPLSSEEPPEKTPDERVEDHWHERHGTLEGSDKR